MTINETSIVERARYLVGGDFSQEMRERVRSANQQLERLRKAEIAGRHSALRMEQIRLFRSFDARLCAIVDSVDARSGLTAKDLRQHAQDLDPFSDPGEPVRVRVKIKSSREDWRPICAFGPHRKAVQTLVAYVLDARFGAHPLDYMASGRGCDVAADRVKEFVDAGFEWFVLADIENCFGSINPREAATLLRLPQTVITHCLTIREEVPLHISPYLPETLPPLALSETVQHGLSQGARSANRVVVRLLGPDIQALAPSEHKLLYGDDVILAALTREEAEAAAKALKEMLASHPAGPFRLKRLDVVHVNDGFDFLKYRFKRDWLDGSLKIRPAAKSYKNFNQKVLGIIQGEAVDTVHEKVLAYRAHWLAAFPRYVRTQEQETQALNLLWQSAVASLPPHLIDRWDKACALHWICGKATPGTLDDWLDVVGVSLEAPA